MEEVDKLFARIDTTRLYPPFYEMVYQALEEALHNGHRYIVTHGWRSQAEQLGLWIQHKKGGPRAAPPGLSAHNYGLAIDVVADLDPSTDKLEPDWRAPAYDALGAAVIKAGLVWGASFGDRPHVQWPAFVNGSELAPLKEVWFREADASTDERLAAVWAEVDEEQES